MCSIFECEGSHHAKGYCIKHYYQHDPGRKAYRKAYWDRLKESGKRKQRTPEQNKLAWAKQTDTEEKREKIRARHRAAKYDRVRDRRQKLATPKWLTKEQKKQISDMYKNRAQNDHVDHIVPLKGKDVCGLHVPWNLQYLPAEKNLKKGNKT